MILPTRLAVFDVDGTLVDSQHNIVSTMISACERIGVAPPSPSATRQIIGLSLPEAIRTLLPDSPEATRQQVVMAYKSGFAELRQRQDHHEPLFPGVLATLDALDRQGWRLAVATGNSRRGLAMLIAHHRLEGRFVSMQTADDNPGKPNPAMLNRAIAEAGAQPSSAVMIGDTSYDMQMGRDAGTRTVGVGWGYHPPAELLRAGAESVVDSTGDLLVRLNSLFPQP
jgi:phosphoglycolate phosphatase